MPTFSFPTGVGTPTGAYVVIQVTDDGGRPVPGNLYADYRFSRDTEGFGTDWLAVSLCRRPSEDSVYGVGENGEVIRIAPSGNVPELIMPAAHGPTEMGPMREIRLVGDSLYAVGMGRQVYRRAESGNWERVDAGILDLSGRPTTGLTSITGDGRGFLASVGYEGEVWEFHQTWVQIDSPTNVLLNRIAWHDGALIAAGVMGTVLRRQAHGWEAIDTGEFSEDVWDIESFAGKLFLGTANGLFSMASDGVVSRIGPPGFTRQVHCASLDACEGRLWCFGGAIVSSSTDGLTWCEEAIL